MELILEIDKRSKDGKNLVQFLQNLSYVKIKTSSKKSAIDISLNEVKKGKTTTYKSSNELFKTLFK